MARTFAVKTGDPVTEKLTPYQVNDTCREMFESSKSLLRQQGISPLIDQRTGRLSQPTQDALARLERNARKEADRILAQRPFLTTDQRHRIETAVADSRKKTMSVCQDVNTFSYWEEYRETYFFHPRLSRSLATLKAKDVQIPGRVLRALRHPNPLIITPDARPIVHSDGHTGRILGFYVTGAVAEDYPMAPDAAHRVDFRGSTAYRRSVLRDTHCETANALHIMVVSEVHDEDGRTVADFDVANLTIPLVGEFTLDELVEKTADSFSLGFGIGGVTEERLHTYLRTLSQSVVSHLLYATSRSFEADKQIPDREKLPTKEKKGNKTPPAPSRVYPVGYRMGAAIENNDRRRSMPPLDGPGMPTGRVMPAHIRSPHPHLYRVGPGRSEIDIKFLGPIPVNQHLDDGETTTLHPVR